MGQSRSVRSRHTVIALVAAAGILAAGVATRAATGDDASAFVPTSPCRLADTRPAPQRVGPSATLATGATITFQATGSNGECANIPDEATAVSLNVTALGATAQSFLTFWPDGNRPLAASLNPSPGQPPVPNAVVVALSSSGSFSVYNNEGNVNIVVDVNGYYVPSTSGPAGPQGPKGDTGAAGTNGSNGADGSNGPVEGSPCTAGGIAGTVQTYFDATTGALAVRCSRPSYVSTVAGSALSTGSNDATGPAARFNTPIALAIDGAGNSYVADYFNHTIRKITPTGVVSTIAGTAGLAGSADATGPAASFNRPLDVAVDGAGNVYVTDSFNHTVRKITPTGVVTTIAGTAGLAGSTDATGPAARFSTPHGVAVDGAGNLYVADTGNDTIRKITPSGVVTTIAGTAGNPGSTDATGPAARFTQPSTVAVDVAGNVYVADTGNHTIRKIDSMGAVTTIAGTAGLAGTTDATGPAARFNTPLGVAVDTAGNIYVTDLANHTVRKIDPAGAVTTIAGTAGLAGSTDAIGPAARFNFPQGVALDAAGNVYIADTSNHTIRRIA